MTTTADTDVTSVVLDQHKDVAARLTAVLAKSGNDRAEEFSSLADMLHAHETAEETVIYPALRKLGEEGSRIADHRTSEENAAADVLTKLKGLSCDSDEFTTLFTEFSGKVHDHAASEEAEVLPMLTSRIDADERQAMGEAFLSPR
jgi:hemerythrin superfamily protein